jgi:hypothetical protein
MKRRSVVLVAVITGLVVLGGVGVRAAVSQYQPIRLNRQNLGVIPSATITSRDWRALPGEGISDGPVISLRGGLAATLSITVQGGPARFQILLEDVSRNFKEILMTPRSVSFDPGAGTESFSYTFVRSLHPGGYTVNFYWRSPTGVPVTETRGTLVLQYATNA